MRRLRRPPPLVVGVAAVAVYAAVALATARVGDHTVRPLFDGVGPPPAYQWVNPPAQFKSGNLKPSPGTGRVAFTGGRSDAGAFQTPDGQFVVDLTPGAIAPHPPDTSVDARLTPLDPAGLGSLPTPLRAAGNAYRIQLAYGPSKQPLDTVATPGDLFLTVPEPAEVILYSPDGRAWQRLDTKQIATGAEVGTQFSRTGWYVAATSAPHAAAKGGAGGSSGSTVAIVVVVVVVAVGAVLLLGPWAPWRRNRARRPRPPR